MGPQSPQSKPPLATTKFELGKIGCQLVPPKYCSTQVYPHNLGCQSTLGRWDPLLACGTNISRETFGRERNPCSSEADILVEEKGKSLDEYGVTDKC